MTTLQQAWATQSGHAANRNRKVRSIKDRSFNCFIEWNFFPEVFMDKVISISKVESMNDQCLVFLQIPAFNDIPDSWNVHTICIFMIHFFLYGPQFTVNSVASAPQSKCNSSTLKKCGRVPAWWRVTKVSHKLFVLLDLDNFLAFQRGDILNCCAFSWSNQARQPATCGRAGKIRQKNKFSSHSASFCPFNLSLGDNEPKIGQK